MVTALDQFIAEMWVSRTGIETLPPVAAAVATHVTTVFQLFFLDKTFKSMRM